MNPPISPVINPETTGSEPQRRIGEGRDITGTYRVVDRDGAGGTEVVVLDRSGSPLASATVELDAASIARQSGLAKSRVERVAWLTAVRRTPGARSERAQSLALYGALQRARLAGRHELGVMTSTAGDALTDLLALGPVDGENRSVRAQRVDVALARTFAAAQSEADPISPTFLVREVDAFLQKYFERIWQTSWFRAVEEGTLTRGQYVYTLSNMHQFVRFTTRILARCVAAAHETELRLHFIRHLKGEINHEIIIEKDLEALGEDVAFVTGGMSPNLATRQFMAAQESAIGFHGDPVLLMAAPLAAEGISGHLDQRFMDALHRNVRRWGVADPEKVTRFYSSHIEFDGGDDGHWESTMAVLATHIRDEATLSRFMSMLRVTTDAMIRCYDSWIDDIALG